MNTFLARLTLRSLFTSGPLLLVATAASADTIHVPQDASTIQAGIDLALPGDRVVVADGCWTGDGNRDLTLPPFDIVVTSENGPEACVIFSDGTVRDPHRAFLLAGPHTRATVIRGFTISGGETEVGAIEDRFNAGGILVQSGQPTVEDCRFVDNRCSCWGGAVCVSGPASPRFTRCMFMANHSDAEGGAFFSWGSGRPVVENSVFIDNTAGIEGGAIMSFNPIVMNHITVTRNSATFRAGGIRAWASTLTNSIVWDNSAPSDPNVTAGQMRPTYCLIEGGPLPGPGNIDADPRFQADGWHLRSPISPCIEAGDPKAVLRRGERDLDGGLRRVGRRVDIGADEALMRDQTPV